MSGIICDRKVVLAKLKGNMYSTAVRPAMLYITELLDMTKIQEEELKVAELRMLKFAMGLTRMDKIRNEYIRGSAVVERIGKLKEWRLRWHGSTHVVEEE